MSDISDSMKSLCEDITATHENRKRNLKDLKEQVRSIRNNAIKFINDCRRLHEKMAKDLKRVLTENTEDLRKKVSSIKEEFEHKEKEVRSDLKEARRLWSKMSETLKAKRKR